MSELMMIKRSQPKMMSFNRCWMNTEHHGSWHFCISFAVYRKPKSLFSSLYFPFQRYSVFIKHYVISSLSWKKKMQYLIIICDKDWVRNLWICAPINKTTDDCQANRIRCSKFFFFNSFQFPLFLVVIFFYSISVVLL